MSVDDSKNTYVVDIETERGVMLAVKGGVKTTFFLDYNPTWSSWVAKAFGLADTHIADEDRIYRFVPHAHDEVVMIMGGDYIHGEMIVDDGSVYDGVDFEAIEKRMMAHMREVERRVLLAGDLALWRGAIDFGLDDVVAAKETPLKPLPHEPHRTYDWRQRIASRRRRHRK